MARKKIIIFLVQFFLSGLFLYSGISKLLALPKFAEVLHAYQLFSMPVIPFAAVYIAAVETLIGLAFLSKKSLKVASFSGAILLVIFQFGLFSLIYRNIEMDCGCFGGLAFSPEMALWRNFAILLQLGYIFYNLFDSKFLGKFY